MIASSHIHGGLSLREKEYFTGWQRTLADLDNLRKRLHGEREQFRSYESRRMIEPLIALADNFRALVLHVPQEFQTHAWAQGVLHVARQFEQLMQEMGVKIIEGEHKPFDPHTQEAVEKVKHRGQSDIVVQVMQPGYMIGDIVVRPAKVKVSE